VLDIRFGCAAERRQMLGELIDVLHEGIRIRNGSRHDLTYAMHHLPVVGLGYARWTPAPALGGCSFLLPLPSFIRKGQRLLSGELRVGNFKTGDDRSP
jgi:hypothetical protein